MLNGYGFHIKNAISALYSPFIENPIILGKCIEFDFDFPKHSNIFTFNIYFKSLKNGNFK